MSPDAAAQLALTLYDADGDGAISGAELDKSPALKAALATIDADGDGRITAEELAQRIRAWQQSYSFLQSVVCEVTLDGRPLADAAVTFEPDPLLGDAVPAATGQTDERGLAVMAMAPEHAPDGLHGVYLGLYTVRVSKPSGSGELLPARYNTESQLGVEVSPDARAADVRLDLRSR